MKKVIGVAIIVIICLFLVIGLIVLAVQKPALVMPSKKLAPGLPVEVGKRDIMKNILSQSAPMGYLAEEKDITGTEVQPTPLEISQMKINLTLDADYAKQGERKLTSSDVDFKGEFVLKNPLKEQADLTFNMPLPTEGGMITNVELLVDGKEPEGVTYEQNQISWTNKFAPLEEKKVSVTYKTKAIKNYRFELTHGKRIPNLLLDMVVKGTRKVDFPSDTLTPTKRRKIANGWNLKWSFNKLITSYDVGVDLPEKQPSALDLGRILYGGPLFLLAFLVCLMVGTGVVKLKQQFNLAGTPHL